MRNTEEYRGYQYEDEEDEEEEEYKEDEEDEDDEDEEYKDDEDEEYKEEREGESPHILAFRQEAKIVDHWMYERLEDDLDLADGTWLSRDTRALCIMLREAVDNTMGKEQSEARTEVAEEVARIMFQPLTEGTATRKYLHSADADKIGDSEKQELLEYIAEDQKAFQTFLADGKMDERDSIIGMHEAVACSVTVAWTDSNMEIVRDLHNPDMKECRELEYKEEEAIEGREGESPHMLAFRVEMREVDHRMYERFEDDPDLADGTWDSEDTLTLCITLREVVDNTMGKEQSEARTEVTEEVARMLFQPLAESTATGKHLHWVHADYIGDSEKQELLEYLAKEQRAFQTFLADGQMDEWDATKGMDGAVGGGINWTEGDIEMAREIHNPDIQE